MRITLKKDENPNIVIIQKNEEIILTNKLFL